jgi:hypothetical protein
VIRLRGEGEEEEEEKEGEVEKTGYRLHLMSMGEGALTAFKYPVGRFHQDEMKWLCTRGPKNSTRKRAHLGPSNEGGRARKTREYSPVAHPSDLG